VPSKQSCTCTVEPQPCPNMVWVLSARDCCGMGTALDPWRVWVRISGNLTVRFTSDGSAEYPGFAAVLEGSLCPGGTFSSTGRLVNGSCPGVCPAGYACPAGSTSGTAVGCPGGTFGATGQSWCSEHFMEDRCCGAADASVLSQRVPHWLACEGS
jgi:hypothetical protein